MAQNLLKNIYIVLLESIVIILLFKFTGNSACIASILIVVHVGFLVYMFKKLN